MDKNSVRVFVDDLIAKDLVLRQENPQNRREKLITLTKKGKKVALETHKLMLSMQEELFSTCLSKDELKTYQDILRKCFYSLCF